MRDDADSRGSTWAHPLLGSSRLADSRAEDGEHAASPAVDRKDQLGAVDHRGATLSCGRTFDGGFNGG